MNFPQEIVRNIVRAMFGTGATQIAAGDHTHPGGPGDLPTWGDIDGTLSDQTDLQSALDNKSDITHNHDADYEPLGAVASAIATHEGAVNPHPTYLTQAEGDGFYAVIGHNHDADYEPLGAVAAHVGLADPHTQYLLESAFNLSTFTTTNLTEGANLYYTDERVDDRINALFVEGAGIDFSYNDGANTFTVTVDLSELSTTTLPEGSNLYYTDERVDDRVAVLIQNGTGITWSYNDGSGTLTPTVTITQYTDELAQDAVGAMIDASLNYVDGTPLLQRAALTGAITASAGSNATVLGSFTKSDLNTAVSDGNVLYVGDSTTASDLDYPETGDLTVATAKYHTTAGRHSCTGSQRITINGTGRLRINN